MTNLSKFREHCARMATAQHKPECHAIQQRPSAWSGTFGVRVVPDPECDGCLSQADRDLFAQMAAEVDDYLAPQVDLFGETTPAADLRRATDEGDAGE